MIVYKLTDEWYIQWQRMTSSGTTNDNDWYNKWQRVVQNITTNDNEWQKMKMSDSEWQRAIKRMKTYKNGFKLKQKTNLVPEEFHSIFMQYVTTIYSAIETI